MTVRFRIRTPEGQELSFPSREIFEDFVRSGDLSPDDLVYDVDTGSWSPARTHPLVLEIEYASEEEGDEGPASDEAPAEAVEEGSKQAKGEGAATEDAETVEDEAEPASPSFGLDLAPAQEMSPEEAKRAFMEQMEAERRQEIEFGSKDASLSGFTMDDSGTLAEMIEPKAPPPRRAPERSVTPKPPPPKPPPPEPPAPKPPAPPKRAPERSVEPAPPPPEASKPASHETSRPSPPEPEPSKPPRSEPSKPEPSRAEVETPEAPAPEPSPPKSDEPRAAPPEPSPPKSEPSLAPEPAPRPSARKPKRKTAPVAAPSFHRDREEARREPEPGKELEAAKSFGRLLRRIIISVVVLALLAGGTYVGIRIASGVEEITDEAAETPPELEPAPAPVEPQPEIASTEVAVRERALELFLASVGDAFEDLPELDAAWPYGEYLSTPSRFASVPETWDAYVSAVRELRAEERDRYRTAYEGALEDAMIEGAEGVERLDAAMAVFDAEAERRAEHFQRVEALASAARQSHSALLEAEGMILFDPTGSLGRPGIGEGTSGREADSQRLLDEVLDVLEERLDAEGRGPGAPERVREWLWTGFLDVVTG